MNHHDLKFIDSVRGLATICVMLSHCLLMFYPAAHTGVGFSGRLDSFLFNSPISFIYKGESAVLVFFVLSGYILSYNCMKHGLSEHYIRSSTIKRYLRLGIPCAASIFICYLLMKVDAFPAVRLGLTDLPLASMYSNSQSFFSMIYSSLYGAMIFSDTRFNYVLWTISIEFFGSMLIFATVILLGFNKNILRCSTILMTVFFLCLDKPYSYYGMFTAGIAISTFKIDNARGFYVKLFSLFTLLLALYLLGCATGSSSYFYISYYLDGLIPWWRLTLDIGAILIMVAAAMHSDVLKPIKNKLFYFLGRISFSCYLLHSFVLSIVGPYAFKYTESRFFGFVICTSLVISITLIISTIFYKYVDKTSIKISNLVGKKVVG
ncbi:acyltransferase [Salmonella enterica]|nr:acyltransferase [Salmonella enterica]EHS7241583.1 acyltransferase [Salmonella enterica]